MQKKIILNGMDEKDLQDYCANLNLPKFHGNQLFRWLYKNNYQDVNKISNIPKVLKQEITDNTLINLLSVKVKLLNSY